MDKILLITQYFPPDMTGTSRVMQELAEDLSKSGYNLEIISGTSHYFNKKSYREYDSDITIKRLWHFTFTNTSKIAQLLSYISFPLSLITHLFSFRKFDKVIIASSPPTVVFIGTLINIFWGKKIYFILQDIYPDLAIHLGALSNSSFSSRGMRYLNKWSFKYTYKIVVLSDSMKQYLRKAYDLPEEKVVIINNWVDAEKIHPLSKDNSWSQVSGYANKFIILYAGNIGFSYNFTPLLEAAEFLKEDKDIIFLIVGEGRSKKELQDYVIEHRLKNIDFISYVAEEDYNKLLASASCHIVIHNPGMDNFNFPVKTYSYMASGRPIIAITQDGGELSQLLASANAGMSVEDVFEFREAVKKLKTNPGVAAKTGENGRNYVLKHHDRKLLTKKYVELLS